MRNNDEDRKDEGITEKAPLAPLEKSLDEAETNTHRVDESRLKDDDKAEGEPVIFGDKDYFGGPTNKGEDHQEESNPTIPLEASEDLSGISVQVDDDHALARQGEGENGLGEGVGDGEAPTDGVHENTPKDDKSSEDDEFYNTWKASRKKQDTRPEDDPIREDPDEEDSENEEPGEQDDSEVEDGPKVDTKRRDFNWIAPLAGVGVAALLSCSYVLGFSESAHTQAQPNQEVFTDNNAVKDTTIYGEMPKIWDSQDKPRYTDLISNTEKGYVVAVQGLNRIERLNPDDGSTLWSYERKGAEVCDIAQIGDDVVALFDAGGGCSELVKLNGITGSYAGQAQYAVKDETGLASLTVGGDHIAVVTPNSARLLNSDLGAEVIFGHDTMKSSPDEVDFEDCEVSDALSSNDLFAVGAKCKGEETYKVYLLKTKQEDWSYGKVEHIIDTHTTEPITIPLITDSSVISVAQDNNAPAARVWDVNTLEEKEAYEIPVGVAGYPYQVDQKENRFGYVWRIGDWIRYTIFSDGVTATHDLRDAVGDPMLQGDMMFYPAYDGLRYVDFNTDETYEIATKYPASSRFGFSGNTFFALGDDGVIRAYR